MLIDSFLPHFDFNEVHSVEIDALPDRTWQALMQTDLARPFLIRLLMGIRSLPSLLHDGLRPPKRTTIHDVARGNFLLLAEDPPREIVLGIEGQFWKLQPKVCTTDLASFSGPVPAGMARAVWSFSVDPLGSRRSRLATETRILCGDDASRRRFGRYWAVVQPGSAIIRQVILRAVSRQARNTG
jgi:hypothetical protein